MLQALLLDHDGTLVESETLHAQAWIQTLANHNAVLNQEDYFKHYAGFSTLQNAKDFIELFDLTVSPQTLTRQKVVLTQNWLTQNAFPLIEGARELISWAQMQNLRQAIVTGGQRISVERTLSYYDLGHFIESISSQEDVTNNKPAPDLYLLALERLGLAANNTIAIEDTERGMQAALGADIRCIAVRNEHSQTHDFTGAMACVNSLPEALAWLQAHYASL